MSRTHGGEVAPVERGELGLPEALDDRKDGGVDEPDAEVPIRPQDLVNPSDPILASA